MAGLSAGSVYLDGVFSPESMYRQIEIVAGIAHPGDRTGICLGNLGSILSQNRQNCDAIHMFPACSGLVNARHPVEFMY
ncbi:MAG: hypothetical protein IT488_13465 [Gammaproteobacteria bacterium]|nr:hypothetical protein [Gammaproteobacteria bacterium]